MTEVFVIDGKKFTEDDPDNLMLSEENIRSDDYSQSLNIRTGYDLNFSSDLVQNSYHHSNRHLLSSQRVLSQSNERKCINSEMFFSEIPNLERNFVTEDDPDNLLLFTHNLRSDGKLFHEQMNKSKTSHIDKTTINLPSASALNFGSEGPGDEKNSFPLTQTLFFATGRFFLVLLALCSISLGVFFAIGNRYEEFSGNSENDVPVMQPTLIKIVPNDQRSHYPTISETTSPSFAAPEIDSTDSNDRIHQSLIIDNNFNPTIPPYLISEPTS